MGRNIGRKIGYVIEAEIEQGLFEIVGAFLQLVGMGQAFQQGKKIVLFHDRLRHNRTKLKLLGTINFDEKYKKRTTKMATARGGRNCNPSRVNASTHNAANEKIQTTSKQLLRYTDRLLRDRPQGDGVKSVFRVCLYTILFNRTCCFTSF